MINKLTLLIVVGMFLPVATSGQQGGELIINPKLMGGYAGVEFPSPGILHRDSVHVISKEAEIINLRDYNPPGSPPTGLLITGMVPDPSKRWVVAVTKDQEEFRRVFPEYRRLLSEGKRQEAARLLYIDRNINVSTKVEGFWGGVKTADMPEKAGSFFYTFLMLIYRKHGGCLTFLSYEPLPGDDIVDFGTGLGETVHGVLLIEEHEAENGEKPEYTMQVVKARTNE